jgi:hypothetical protein
MAPENPGPGANDPTPPADQPQVELDEFVGIAGAPTPRPSRRRIGGPNDERFSVDLNQDLPTDLVPARTWVISTIDAP